MNTDTNWQAVANAIDAMVTALNGPKRALVAAGWDERNAERVVIAGIELAARGGSTDGEEDA